MRLLRVLPAAGLVAGLAFVATPAHAAITPTAVLTQDVLPGIASAVPTGTPAATARMDIGVSLAGQNRAALAALVASQADRNSPDYQHFLTPAEYAAEFGAPAASTAAARQWLAGGGLTIDQVSTAGTLIAAHGTVAQVESLFHVTEKSFRTSGGTSYLAATSAPTVLAGAGITEVTGLETLNVAHTSASVVTTAKTDFPLASTTTPSDLWSVYDQPAGNRGSGQSLSAFGWGSSANIESDLRTFELNNKLPAIPFTIKTIGDAGTDTSGQDEWDLDSQASTGMAPDAKSFTFYFVTSGTVTLIADAVQAWADDPNGSLQASGSYGLCEAFAAVGEFTAHEAALQQAAAEGRTFFASTGDNGSGCSAAGAGVNGATIGPVPSQEFPATSAYATAVGGTVLYATGTGTLTGSADGTPVTRQEETAWTHGGGGPAHFETRPSWQNILSDTTRNPVTAAQVAGQECVGDYAGNVLGNLGDCRVEADVSAQGGDLTGGYDTVVSGATEAVAGTSLSAPLWQGMWARINAAAPKNASGSYNLGFAPPLLYGIYADTTKYASDFYDVTLLANGLYAAGPGWDYPTGLGTPDVDHLMKDLAGSDTPANPSVPNPVPTASGGGGAAVTACGAYPQVTDPTGDATFVVAADSGVAQADDPDVDITSAGFTYDAGTNALTAHITLADLSSTEQGNGENYRFFFNIGTTQYELQANHSATSGTTTYTFGGSGLNATSASTTGTRTVATNEITIALPAALFKTVTGDDLVAGLPFTGLSLDGQRDVGTTTLTADEASATCTYLVGQAAPAASLPEAPYAPLLVLAGIVPVGVIVLRRRARKSA